MKNKKEEIEKQIAELKIEQSKLFKVKSASPIEIIDRTSKVNKRIQALEERLKEIK